MTPARISSVTLSPAAASARTTCAVPSVGWPANGISKVGVKMRTCAVATVDGSTNVVSDRLNCSASACIVASSSPRAVLEHAERVAGERRFGEHVDDAIGVGGHAGPSILGRVSLGRGPRAHRLVERARQRAQRVGVDGGGRDDERIGDGAGNCARSRGHTSGRSAVRGARRRARPSRRRRRLRSSARSSCVHAAARGGRAARRASPGRRGSARTRPSAARRAAASACRRGRTRAVRIAASSASGTWTVPIFLLSDST